MTSFYVGERLRLVNDKKEYGLPAGSLVMLEKIDHNYADEQVTFLVRSNARLFYLKEEDLAKIRDTKIHTKESSNLFE